MRIYFWNLLIEENKKIFTHFLTTFGMPVNTLQERLNTDKWQVFFDGNDHCLFPTETLKTVHFQS